MGCVHRKEVGSTSYSSLAIAGSALGRICSSVSCFGGRLAVHRDRVSGSPRMVHQLNIVTVGATVRYSVCNGRGSDRVYNDGLVGNVNNSYSCRHGNCVSVFAARDAAGGNYVSTVIPVYDRISDARRSISIVIARRNITSLHNGNPLHHTGRVVRGYTRPSCHPVLHRCLGFTRGKRRPRDVHTTLTVRSAFLGGNSVELASFKRCLGWRGPQWDDRTLSKVVMLFDGLGLLPFRNI